MSIDTESAPMTPTPEQALLDMTQTNFELAFPMLEFMHSYGQIYTLRQAGTEPDGQPKPAYLVTNYYMGPHDPPELGYWKIDGMAFEDKLARVIFSNPANHEQRFSVLRVHPHGSETSSEESAEIATVLAGFATNPLVQQQIAEFKLHHPKRNGAYATQAVAPHKAA